MIFNLPNTLTWGRILLIPVIVGVFFVPDTMFDRPTQNLVATAVFILAAVTDWLDGWLARSLSQTSAFGAFLDPVADKLMVAASLIVLVQLNRVNAIIAFIIIGREITISALREWMAKVGEGRSVAVATIGKMKTIAQMVAIPLLLFDGRLLGFHTGPIGTACIDVAAALTIWSMFYYLKKAAPALARPD
ncbi:MAG: CDP-diacylglycerol--glycerol-3-phosphate 3-phosphatidyltransferase [Sterolibacteriaceae bacterium]|jgi:CDP-diacylglycerol--glycerol-3-phosphate 3-phosphatidyltransferase|nr:CDP-diacylglycerol--glycerol-3-phosphate 3-phosphatidyltransferase [Sterolibacteriaceae bacterium]MBK9084389.1 CDP-diacylglycerol--glycerol-3-phosphate 3-phosphatidyltransferase [Sterolibacteriaceae bacterium]